MLKRARYRNFQGHKETVLVFHPCVTAIIGPNDAGKSATFRGILAAACNAPMEPSFWAMAEKLMCSVKLEFDDCTVERQRVEDENGKLVSKSNKVYLTIDGKRHEVKSLRGGYPEYLLEAIRMDEVRFDGSDPFSVNVHDQGDGPFLIGKEFSAATRLKILGMVTDHHLFDTALRDINLERKREEERARAHLDLKREAEDLLQALAGERDWRELEEALAGRVELLNSHHEDLQHQGALLAESRSLRSSTKRTERALDLLSPVDSLAISLGDLGELRDSLQELEEFSVAWTGNRGSLEEVQRQLAVTPSDLLRSLGDRLEDVETLRDPAHEALLADWRRHLRLRGRTDRALDLLGALDPLQGLARVHGELEDQISACLDLQEAFDRLDRDAEALAGRERVLDDQRRGVEEELKDALSKTTRCPFWDETELQPACRKKLEGVEV